MRHAAAASLVSLCLLVPTIAYSADEALVKALKDLDSRVYTEKDEQKQLAEMLGADIRKRRKEANERETAAWGKVKTKEDWETFRDAFAHLILPSIVLAAATLGLITRTTRASMLESMQQDYVRVARAKGLRSRRIVIGHILPNALIPIVTLGGLAYANLLTGAVLTETIFSWPGLGRYTFRSAVTLDFPAIMGITLIVAIVYLIINLLIDVSYALLDPRVVR